MATEHCDKVAAGADPGLSLSGKSSGCGPELFCNSSVPAPSLSCNSSGTAIAILGAYRAHRLARWFSGIRPTCHTRPYRASVPLSRISSGTAIAILGAYRAYQLARWHRFVSIEHREPLQTSLQGTFARAMICRKASLRLAKLNSTIAQQ